jgi:hypothetical protein
MAVCGLIAGLNPSWQSIRFLIIGEELDRISGISLEAS